LRNPIDKFPEGAGVTDSQVVYPAQRKQRHENAGDLFFRGKIHHVRT
jgi:hypothetical protein